MATSARNIEYVLADEKKEVGKRRSVIGEPYAFVEEQPDGRSENHTIVDERQIEETLTGVALSGGGVRAAAFSLGFIQSLYETGRMKFVDYLSTVSGGGYAGALFSAEVANFNGKINWDRGNGDTAHERLSIETSVDGRQPTRVTELALHGRMMGNMLRMLSRHLFGFLVTNAFVLSGVAFVAALLAYVMKFAWKPSLYPYMAEMGFPSDLSIPFFPAFLAMWFWIGCQLAARIAKAKGKPPLPITQHSYILLLSTVVLGIISFLSVGDINIGNIVEQFDVSIRVEKQLNTTVSWFGTLLSGIFVSALLPYLMPKRLLESGKSKRGSFKAMLFNVIGTVIVIGGPLFVFYMLAHEDISNTTERRNLAEGDFRTSHVGRLAQFIPALEAQSVSTTKNRRMLASDLLSAINGTPLKDTKPYERSPEIRELLKPAQVGEESLRDVFFVERWIQGLGSIVGLSKEFDKRIAKNKAGQDRTEQIVDRINRHCLANPNLFAQMLLPSSPPDSESSQTSSSSRDQIIEKEQVLKGLHLVRRQTSLAEKDDFEFALEELESASNLVKQLYDEAMKAGGTEQAKPSVEANPTNTELLQRFRFFVIKEAQSNLTKKNKLEADFEHNTGILLCEIESIFNAPPTNEFWRTFEADEHENLFAGLDEFKSREKVQFASLLTSIRQNNWMLLRELYPNYIRSPDVTFNFIVHEADQARRLYIALGALAVFLLTGLATNLNTTSLHGVYRDQLSEIWLPEPNTRLSKLDTCSKGAPIHIINGTVNRMGHRTDPDLESRSRFTMTNRYCGSNKIGFRETREYHQGELRVSDAIAISGAAVTTVTAGDLLFRTILFLTNFRLGQWMRNPAEYHVDHYWPSPLLTLVQLGSYPEHRKYLFVSDGGHLDNTGLSALLERRCKVIFYADASYDPECSFSNLFSVLHAARAKYGIRVEEIVVGNQAANEASSVPSSVNFWVSSIKPNEEGLSKAHFLVIRLRYPDNSRATMFVAKTSLTGDEPPELVTMARRDDDQSFPNDPTTDQFLPPHLFEAYVTLGKHIGDEIDELIELRKLPAGWLPELMVGGPEPAVSHLDDTDHPTTDAVDTEDIRQLLRHLDEQPFDEEEIDRALGVIGKSLATLAAKPSDTMQAAATEEVVSMIRSWSVERGEDSSPPRRRRFCDGLLQLMSEFDETILADLDLKYHFLWMLRIGSDFTHIAKKISSISSSDKDIAETQEQE